MLEVSIRYQTHVRQIEHPAGPLEFGRQAPPDGAAHVILDDPTVSRFQLRVEASGPDGVRLTNLSRHVPALLYDGRRIEPGGQLEVPTPVQVRVGDTWLEFLDKNSAQGQEKASHTLAMPQRSLQAQAESRGLKLANLGEAPSPDRFAQWLESVLSVQRSAVGSNEFYFESARALVEIVGLDRGFFLNRRQTPGEAADWELAADFPAHQHRGTRWSMTILSQMIEKRCTLCQSIEKACETNSLAGIEAVVVSPLFDSQAQIIGALYGLRVAMPGKPRPEIRPLEAQVVQLLAAAADTGLARQQQEIEAIRVREQFDTFFGKSLADELVTNPQMLAGIDREITSIFCDVCGFSRLSEQVGPAMICEVINDCMEQFTEVVQQHEGVVVDYVGDGMLAMWNAPKLQPDHAALACIASRAVATRLPLLNAKWEAKLGRPLDVAIGINTGMARVGNIGSRRRLKYGPLGHSVNLASRIQGTARHLNIRVAAGEATFQQLPASVRTRRLGAARVVGMQAPLGLYQVEEEPTTADARPPYEQALQAFEQGDLAGCIKCLESPAAGPAAADGPSAFLLRHAKKLAATPDVAYKPELVFDQK